MNQVSMLRCLCMALVAACVLLIVRETGAAAEAATHLRLYARDVAPANNSSNDTASQPDNSTGGTDPPNAGDIKQDPTCNQSSNLAMFLIRSPNMSANLYFIGGNMTIKWTYTINVKTIPSNVAISIRNLAWSGTRWQFIGNTTGTGSPYIWNIPPLAAGSYRLKMVADNKDNTIQPSDPSEVVCYNDGDVVTSISQTFKITDNAIPDSTKNPYPANAAVRGSAAVPLAVLAAVAFALAVGC